MWVRVPLRALMNPYTPPKYEKTNKYKPPIIDIWGLFFVFMVIIIVPALFLYILSWFI